jgi:hypothetical protein
MTVLAAAAAMSENKRATFIFIGGLSRTRPRDRPLCFHDGMLAPHFGTTFEVLGTMGDGPPGEHRGSAPAYVKAPRFSTAQFEETTFDGEDPGFEGQCVYADGVSSGL